MNDPFWNRKFEWDLYSPLVGNSMLELGNKINRELTYKAFFEERGYRHVSVDTNGKDGALRIDLSKPMDIGTFDMVTNIGTTEHVSEGDWNGQVQCWKNILNAMHVDSVLICTTPAPGHWSHHGVWYPHPEFYEKLAANNGLEVERIYCCDFLGKSLGMAQRDMIHARLRRFEDAPAVVTNDGMVNNVRRKTEDIWL